MNSLTHFLFATNLLLIFFADTVPLKTLALFAFLFGVIVDSDVFIRMGILRHKHAITRTWLQEPFGLIIIGGTVSLIMQYIFGTPFGLLVFIPYASHVLLDYISIHQARPFNPISKRVYTVGWIETRLLNKKDVTNWSRLNENYFTLLNIVLFVVLLVQL